MSNAISDGNHKSDAPKLITFYTSRITPSCRAVRMLATHLDIRLEEVYLRCYIDTRTEKFRQINPCHTLPVIDDNGFILWESRAIMQYLCNKYAPHSSLYPSDPQERATVDRLLNFDLKTLSHAVMAVHYEFTFPGEYSSSRGEKLVAVTDALTLLEIFLINKEYVACDHLTIADLSILASVTLLEVAVEFDLTSYPNIWNWYNRLRNELPYYDPLTKVAHDELRALINTIRDAHEEWSSPLHQCAFVPNGSHGNCAEEQRSQYKRLFLNANDQKDAARIMAAVSPAFRKSSYAHNQMAQSKDSFIISAQMNEGHETNSESEIKKMVRKSYSEQASNNGGRGQTTPFVKRIRLTIEPNTGQSLQLSHLDSPQLENWPSNGESPLDTFLYANKCPDGPHESDLAVNNNNTDQCFSENFHLSNETFCPNC